MAGQGTRGGNGGESSLQNARDAALRFLAYRPRSEAEVRRRLLRRYPPDIVQQVVQQLRGQHFLDDTDFARQWRDNRERHRPRAGRLVRQELLRLGVPTETAQDALQGFDNQANAQAAAARLAGRLSSRGYSSEELRRRLWSHLRQRGFSFGEIREAVEGVLAELGTDLLHGQDHPDDDEN
jgi:regulatory protein